VCIPALVVIMVIRSSPLPLHLLSLRNTRNVSLVRYLAALIFISKFPGWIMRSWVVIVWVEQVYRFVHESKRHMIFDLLNSRRSNRWTSRECRFVHGEDPPVMQAGGRRSVLDVCGDESDESVIKSLSSHLDTHTHDCRFIREWRNAVCASGGGVEISPSTTCPHIGLCMRSDCRTHARGPLQETAAPPRVNQNLEVMAGLAKALYTSLIGRRISSLHRATDRWIINHLLFGSLPDASHKVNLRTVAGHAAT